MTPASGDQGTVRFHNNKMPVIMLLTLARLACAKAVSNISESDEFLLLPVAITATLSPA